MARPASAVAARIACVALLALLLGGCYYLRPAELPLGGETKGRDAIMANFAQIPNYWSSFSVEPSEFIDGGDTVVVLGTQRAGNDKGSFESPFVHVMKYDGDGKLLRGEFHADSAKAAKLLA